MKQYGFTVEKNLYTHNYWCNIRNGRTGTLDELNKRDDGYKNCPVYIRKHWNEFKGLVNSYIDKNTSKKEYRVTLRFEDEEKAKAAALLFGAEVQTIQT